LPRREAAKGEEGGELGRGVDADGLHPGWRLQRWGGRA
jgi:hypothetical protein